MGAALGVNLSKGVRRSGVVVVVALVSVLALVSRALAKEATRLGPGACVYAAYLVEHNHVAAAASNFEALLKIDPTLQCAEQGIGSVASSEVAAAKKAAAKQKPAAKPKSATQKLKAGGKSLQDFAKAALSVLAGAGLIVGASLGVIAAVMVLLALLFRLPGFSQGSRWISRQEWGHAKLSMRWPRRQWVNFRGWIVRGFNWLAGCTFKVGGFKSAESATGADSIAASMRASLGIGDGASPGDAQLVSTTTASAGVLSEVASALKAVPQLAVIGPLLTLGRSLLPRDTYSIDGVVVGDSARGYGLAISITAQGGSVVATQTLWSETFSPTLSLSAEAVKDADRLQRLGMAAAAWLIFRIAELRGNRQERLKSLGCSNWNSYALFRAGVECQRSGELERATALYARAVDADPSNNPARLNLGVIEVLNGQIATAISRLAEIEAAEREGQTSSTTILDRSSLWYQAAYNLAAARLSDAHPNGSAAYATALDLVITIERARKQLKDNTKPRQAARTLGDFLAHIRAPAFALLADAAATYGGRVARGRRMTDQNWLRPLEVAQRAYKAGSDSATAKRSARALGRRVAISTFEPGRGYRAHYNLACYWTRVKKWDDAVRELRLALEAGNVGDMAQTDLALATLKKQRPDEWAKLFGPSPRPLAAFLPIGSAAQALYDAYGIDGAHELVARSDTDAKRQDLANKLVVSPEAVREWHDLLEMGTKLGLELTTLNLLAAARITSLSDLKTWTNREVELSEVLAQANATGSFVDTAPTANVVKAWLGALGT